MKKLLLIATILISYAAGAGNHIPNEKVLKTFNQVFSDAVNIQWRNSTTYEEASFESGIIKIRALFNSDGTLIQTIRYYKEEQLLVSIRYKIKKKYEEQEIVGVTEISKDNITTYNINLIDATTLYILTVDSYGNIDQVSKFKRGDI